MEKRGCHVIKRNVRDDKADKGVIFYRLRIESSTDDNTGASSEVLESPCKPTDEDFLGTSTLSFHSSLHIYVYFFRLLDYRSDQTSLPKIE